MKRSLTRLITFMAPAIVIAACSNGVPLGPSTPPPTTTPATTPAAPATPAPATPATPATPTTPATTPTAVAYTPDLQPVFNSDCIPCHGGSRAAGRYSMTSYASVMAAVTPKSASSALVLVTQPGGVMYSFLTGDRTGKSAMIRTWVLNGAPQSR